MQEKNRAPDMTPCVVIPAYNEERHIADVVRGALGHVGRVIVVDDGSRDGTAKRARTAGAEVVVHERNLGKGAALKRGMEEAFGGGGDPVIILDADAQHDPDEIPLFLEAARESGAEIIVGNRMESAGKMPFVRRATNWFTSFCTSALAGQRIPDSQCGYRLIRRGIFNSLGFSAGRFATETEMLIEASRAGGRIASIPVRTIYGEEKSTINPFLDTIRFFRVVLVYLLKAGKRQ